MIEYVPDFDPGAEVKFPLWDLDELRDESFTSPKHMSDGYELFGIVIHSGTNDGGHCYCNVRVWGLSLFFFLSFSFPQFFP